eukprot:CAMPEP_0119303044 /NCGR_PEP_ID=MMETSP1333-20130426/4539_1 /TAXON_ID=418940 /ORGANISM="Scyphosphaera apsteinii, Strain RCC1455" /LENGTH=391 /DNA_ID=CAMNT_0007305605 /DNA_START=228 /DNA_END=1403 /DNA_ORIENTATION=+
MHPGCLQDAAHMHEQFLRAACLVLIVVQNSSLILVTSYSRMLQPPYLASVAVFFAEVLKFVAAVVLLALERRSMRVAVRLIGTLLHEYSWETMQFAVPALCYTLQNNLWYYALSHLDPVTAAVTSQMKVITTAIASVLMLGRRLTQLQWLALAALTVGLVVMQMKETRASSSPRSTPPDSLGGASAMLLATVLSAYSGVYLEKLFKTLKLTIWLQSVQLSIFALPVAGFCMLLYDRDTIQRGEMLSGFNSMAWLAVILNAIGGIAVSMALKYADNIQKTFAVGVSIVLNCGVSALLFEVPLTPRVITGVSMVVGSTCIFYMKHEGENCHSIACSRVWTLLSTDPRREMLLSLGEVLPLMQRDSTPSGVHCDKAQQCHVEQVQLQEVACDAP